MTYPLIGAATFEDIERLACQLIAKHGRVRSYTETPIVFTGSDTPCLIAIEIIPSPNTEDFAANFSLARACTLKAGNVAIGAHYPYSIASIDVSRYAVIDMIDDEDRAPGFRVFASYEYESNKGSIKQMTGQRSKRNMVLSWIELSNRFTQVTRPSL